MFIPIRYGVELFESPLRSRPAPTQRRFKAYLGLPASPQGLDCLAELGIPTISHAKKRTSVLIHIHIR